MVDGKNNKEISSGTLPNEAVDTMEDAFKKTQASSEDDHSHFGNVLDGFHQLGKVLKQATNGELHSKENVVKSLRNCRNFTANLKTCSNNIYSEAKVVVNEIGIDPRKLGNASKKKVPELFV